MSINPEITPEDVTQLSCVGIAAVGGCLSAVSINILAYAAHVERQGNYGRRVKWALPVNLVLGVIAQLIFLAATNRGPVALAMPVQTAAQLMMNMLIQVRLRMKEFTKPMRIGTLTIVCAIMCLIDVGPKEQSDQDPEQLLRKPPAIVFLIFAISVTVLGSIIIWCKPSDLRMKKSATLRGYSRREMAETTTSLFTMCGYAAAQSSTIVLTTSMGKVLSRLPLLWRLGIGALWLLISVFNVVVASLAAKRCDASFYVPLFAMSKLLLNAAAGLCIWEDGKTLNYITSYIMVYVLITMGVYLLSSIDVVGMIAMRRMGGATDGTDNFHTSGMGEVTQDLVSLWKQASLCGSQNEEYASHVVRCFLGEGLDNDSWNDTALLDLCMMMMKGKYSSGDPQFLSWIQANLQSEPKLVQELVEIMPIGSGSPVSQSPRSRRNTGIKSWVDGAMGMPSRRASTDEEESPRRQVSASSVSLQAYAERQGR